MHKPIFRSLALGVVAVAVFGQDAWVREIDNQVVQVQRRFLGFHETLPVLDLPPALLVFLTEYSVRLTFTEGKPQEIRGQAGGVFWHTGGRIGLENMSGHRIEVARVLPKYEPSPEAASTAGNKRPGTVFGNALIGVHPVHNRAGKIVPMHDARLPKVLFYLTGAWLRLSHADGRVEEFRTKPGEAVFFGAGRFAGEFLGREPVEGLHITLKLRGSQAN